MSTQRLSLSAKRFSQTFILLGALLSTALNATTTDIVAPNDGVIQSEAPAMANAQPTAEASSAVATEASSAVATEASAAATTETSVKPSPSSPAVVAVPAPVLTETIADAIYYGGDILTMEGALPTYTEAVATKDKRIIFVGTKVEAMKLSGDITKLINISGKTMLPGFIEPHVHPSIAATMLPNEIIAPYDWILPTQVKKGVSGHLAYLQRLKQSIDANAQQDKVYFVWGYHQLWHGELNRAMLNELSPDKPVAVIHRSFHEIFLNDAAIKKFGINQEDFSDNPQVDWAKGHFFEGGWLALLPKISADLLNPERYKQGLKIMSQLVLKNGITTIAEPGFPSANFDMEYELLKSEMDSEPPYDVFLIPSGTYLYNTKGQNNDDTLAFIETLEGRYNTDNIKFLPKQIKLFSDGAIYSQLMQMEDGYIDGHEGEWMTPPTLLQQQLRFYWQQGYKIHVHANGDLGIQQVLDFNQADQALLARKDHRFTLHHMGYFTDKQVAQIAKLGIETSVNPYYLWALSDKYSKFGLGSERAENLVRVNSLVQKNIPVSFHSDFSMAPMEPLTLAWTAVNRETSALNQVSQQERITPYVAMQAITINAARTLNLEHEIGSIKVGKKANFVLLEQNPLIITPMQIKDIPVWGVVFEDKVNTVNKPPKMKKLECRVLYLERQALPPLSTVTVTLEDVSKTDISRAILAQKTIEANVQPPYNISLQYDPALVNPNGQYVLRARIEHEGKPLFTSALKIPELSKLSGQMFELLVKSSASTTPTTPAAPTEPTEPVQPSAP